MGRASLYYSSYPRRYACPEPSFLPMNVLLPLFKTGCHLESFDLKCNHSEIFNFPLNAVSKNGLGASRDEGLESLGLSSERITTGNYMEVWEPEQAKRRNWSGSRHLKTSFGSVLELLGELPQRLRPSICSWNHPFTHKNEHVFSNRRYASLTVLLY